MREKKRKERKKKQKQNENKKSHYTEKILEGLNIVRQLTDTNLSKGDPAPGTLCEYRQTPY